VRTLRSSFRRYLSILAQDAGCDDARALPNVRTWRNAAVPGVRGVFRSWMKSRLTAGVVVRLSLTQLGHSTLFSTPLQPERERESRLGTFRSQIQGNP
jgi:hypothetical protein